MSDLLETHGGVEPSRLGIIGIDVQMQCATQGDCTGNKALADTLAVVVGADKQAADCLSQQADEADGLTIPNRDIGLGGRQPLRRQQMLLCAQPLIA